MDIFFTSTVTAWVVFNVFVAVMLALDLGVFHRGSHEVSIRESLTWVAVWASLSLLFNLGVWHAQGSERALEYFTGYLIEFSLSIDNLFVFILIFAYFSVPKIHQHKVLFWGIIGTIVMRAVFILVSVSIIEKFAWLSYIFGAFLIYSAIQMARGKDEEVDLEKKWLVRMLIERLPFTREYDGSKFLTRRHGPNGQMKTYATPLMLVLICVEGADVIFNLDSIPVILAITHDKFIIYTSNIMAVMGLRSLYFALAGMMKLFHYLHYGLAAILIFIGTKMLIHHWYEVNILAALSVVILLLVASIVASVIWPAPANAHAGHGRH